MGGRGSTYSNGGGIAYGFRSGNTGGGGGGGTVTLGAIGAVGARTKATATQAVTQLSVDGATPNYVASAPLAQSNNNANFSATDNAGYHDLYNGKGYFQKQSLTIDQRVAVQNYLSDTPEAGSLYSLSQNMNYNLANGQPLTATQQYTYLYMNQSMHNLGYNLNLERYDHADFINGILNKNGVSTRYDNMTESQLKSALVGTSYQSKSFTSVSYNNFKNAPSNNPFTSRAVKIQYSAKAKAQAMMPGNGAGGKLGEIVLGNTNTFKITDVKFDTTRQARHKGTQSYGAKAVTLFVDVE